MHISTRFALFDKQEFFYGFPLAKPFTTQKIVLLFLTITLLSACGGNGDDAQTTSPQPGQAPDTEAPSVPQGLTAGNVSSSSASFSWSPSQDNIGVSGYHIFRNATPIATLAGATYTDSNLTANTQYSYTVSALDAAGNESGQSQPLQINTSPEMVCEAGEQQQVSCTDQIDNATDAQQTLTCKQDGSGFDEGACQVNACEPGYKIQDNACVLIVGGNIPTFWENTPRSACDIAINDLGKNCASADIACPTTVADVQAAVDAAQPGDSICIRGEAGGGPAGGVYTCTGEPCLNIPASADSDANARNTLANYPGESVTLKGKGNASVWNGNTTGLTTAEGAN